MVNMLRANQVARAIYNPKGPIVYGDCNCCLLANVNVADSCQAFAPGSPIGSLESFQCHVCHCHQNVHRRLDVSNHQLLPTPTQQQTVTQRATQKWVHSNKKDGGNKRKKTWDEHVVEEYKKEQPQILANQLEWTLNMRLENGKNKKIKKDEDEKPDGFEMAAREGDFFRSIVSIAKKAELLVLEEFGEPKKARSSVQFYGASSRGRGSHRGSSFFKRHGPVHASMPIVESGQSTRGLLVGLLEICKVEGRGRARAKGRARGVAPGRGRARGVTPARGRAREASPKPQVEGVKDQVPPEFGASLFQETWLRMLGVLENLSLGAYTPGQQRQTLGVHVQVGQPPVVPTSVVGAQTAPESNVPRREKARFQAFFKIPLIFAKNIALSRKAPEVARYDSTKVGLQQFNPWGDAPAVYQGLTFDVQGLVPCASNAPRPDF
ncbi:hypothetical protein MTR67_001470 [Solanum verrucosum]|uniref:ZF-HD dimerization-type domain-containing protein n=1 Tax=Solanum verrucosum TaxID=315347 RepID=A0AAF0PRX7_SOLVR|nr:hypothetical protein MTR67_001470 [Solanum verrucosum]